MGTGGLLYDLIRAIRSGRATVLVGSGPSTEIGYPGWAGLLGALCESVARSDPKRAETAKAYIANGSYPEAASTIESVLGRDQLVELLCQRFSDNGRRGELYELLASLPFLVYLTTNFDTTLERHIRAAGTAPLRYDNTRESLATFDTAAAEKSLVYLHGNVAGEGQVIITKEDYDLLDSSESDYYQGLLFAHLISHPMVIVGYSLSDPEIRDIARFVAKTLALRTPAIALVPDADSETQRAWRDDFNIVVHSYSSARGHEALRRLLDVVVRALSLSGSAGGSDRPIDEDGLQLAQALHLWRSLDPSGDMGVDAIKSVVIAVLASLEDSVPVVDLAGLAAAAVSADAGGLSETTIEAIAALESAQLVAVIDGRASLTAEGSGLATISNRKYEQVWGVFHDQADIDLGLTADPEKAAQVHTVMEGALADLFTARAHDMLSFAVNEQSPEIGIRKLYEVLSEHAGVISDESLRYRTMDYFLCMLQAPRPQQKYLLEHLAKTFFCLQALRIEPQTNRLVARFVESRALILDSNVLISMLARGRDAQPLIQAVIERAKAAGISVVTTEGFVRELLDHIEWPSSRITNGLSGQELLDAASGVPPYTGNEFLDGWIQRGADEGTVPFSAYIKSCLGGSLPSLDGVCTHLRQRLGIEVLDEPELRESDTYKVAYKAACAAEQEHPQKKASRVHAECQAYGALRSWAELRGGLEPHKEPYVLSFGKYLDSLARAAEQKFDRAVTVSPSTLAAFIDAVSVGGLEGSFTEIMKSEYFRLADGFIDTKKYEKFFSGLVRDAERLYETELLPQLRAMEAVYAPDSLGEIPPLDRPAFVRVAESRVRGAEAARVERARRLEVEGKLVEEREARQKAERKADLAERKLYGKAKYERAEARRKRKPGS